MFAQLVTTTTTTRPPAATKVLTSKFPSSGEMIAWVWNTATGWAGDHLLWVVLGTIALVVWYVATIFSRAVKAV